MGAFENSCLTTPVPNVETLRARIVDGCDTIRHSPGLHQRIRDSMRRRVDACILANGGHFEHFLEHTMINVI